MVLREEKGNNFVDEFELKGKKFYFKEMSEWNLYKSSYDVLLISS